MAGVNAFALLTGAENALASKKKKKAAQQPAASASGHANGIASVGGQLETGSVDSAEAVAIIERSAREARSVEDKCKMWKDWVRQAQDRSPRALKFTDAAGNQLDFAQVLTRSRALEISIDSAVVAGLTADRANLLASLLATFCPQLDGRSAPAVALTLTRLSQLLASDGVDVQGAAQRAVSAVVTSLKASGPSTATDTAAVASQWLDRVMYLDREIAKQQGQLQKLAGTNRGAISKEQTQTARSVFSLTQEKFDLLQPDSIPAVSGAENTHSQALNELRDALAGKLQVSSISNGAPRSNASNKKAAQASLRKEEALLAQQADQVAAQIRTLEAQLKALQVQQQDIREKQHQLQHRQQGSEVLGSKAAVQTSDLAAHWGEELALVETLANTLASLSGNADAAGQVMEVQLTAHAISFDMVAVAQQFLEVARAAIAEVPNKIAFSKQRVTQSEKLAKLGGKGAPNNDAATKMLQESQRLADELLHNSEQVLGSLHNRYTAILQGSAEQTDMAGEGLRQAEALLQDIRALHEAIHASLRPPAPAPKAVAPLAAVSAHSAVAPPAATQPAVAAPAVTLPAATPAQPALVVQDVPDQLAAVVATDTASKPSAAFSAAAAYLASMRPSSARPDPVPVAVPVRKVVQVQAPAPPGSTRQWGKPILATGDGTMAGEALGDGLPTPAEAFSKPASVAHSVTAQGDSSSTDDAAGKKNKKKKPAPV